MTVSDNIKAPDQVFSQVHALVSVLPTIWNERWNSEFETKAEYCTVIMTRWSDGLKLRIAAAERCSAKIVWPTLADNKTMSAHDWQLLSRQEAEPAAIINLTYSARANANHIRTKIIEPGTGLYRQALARKADMENRRSPMRKAAETIAKTLNTTTIQAADNSEQTIHLSSIHQPLVSFRVSPHGVDLNLSGVSHARAAELARAIRRFTGSQP